MHDKLCLNGDLFERAESGEPQPAEIKRQVDRINRAIEVLLGWDVCPNCIASNVDARIDLFAEVEFEETT